MLKTSPALPKVRQHIPTEVKMDRHHERAARRRSTRSVALRAPDMRRPALMLALPLLGALLFAALV